MDSTNSDDEKKNNQNKTEDTKIISLTNENLRLKTTATDSVSSFTLLNLYFIF